VAAVAVATAEAAAAVATKACSCEARQDSLRRASLNIAAAAARYLRRQHNLARAAVRPNRRDDSDAQPGRILPEYPNRQTSSRLRCVEVVSWAEHRNIGHRFIPIVQPNRILNKYDGSITRKTNHFPSRTGNEALCGGPGTALTKISPYTSSTRSRLDRIPASSIL